MLRRGVSLLEVLVSIGVISIGLMGVASLIPLAFHQVQVGSRNDRIVLVRNAAYRNAKVLGLLQPERWIDVANPDVNMRNSLRNRGFVPSSPNDDYRYAFCIDPRRIAASAESDLPNLPNNSSQYRWFPLAPIGGNPDADGVARLACVSLRSSFPRSNHMLLSQADEHFLSQDDLEFELPKQQTLPPVQTSLSVDTVVGGQQVKLPVKRYAKGDFSWFATLVPEHNLGPYDDNSDYYRLSIVVCYERNVPPVATQQNEMIAAVVDPAPPPDQTFIGYAGGDVALDRTLPVKAGEFVLLSRFRRLKFSANRIVKEFGWYRVIASDTIGSQQILTLHGKDWNFANPLGNERTWVTYTPGILSIHEETVRLEGIPN